MLTRSVLALPFDAHPQPPTHAKHDKSMNRFSDLAARLSRLPRLRAPPAARPAGCSESLSTRPL